MQDYYALLDLPAEFTPEELRAAYKAAMRRYHPDVAGDSPEANERALEVNNAFQIFSTPSKRWDYDNIYPEYRREAARRRGRSSQQYGGGGGGGGWDTAGAGRFGRDQHGPCGFCGAPGAGGAPFESKSWAERQREQASSRPFGAVGARPVRRGTWDPHQRRVVYPDDRPKVDIDMGAYVRSMKVEKERKSAIANVGYALCALTVPLPLWYHLVTKDRPLFSLFSSIADSWPSKGHNGADWFIYLSPLFALFLAIDYKFQIKNFFRGGFFYTLRTGNWYGSYRLTPVTFTIVSAMYLSFVLFTMALGH